MSKVSEKCVLITGGASGIGLLLGREVLKRGASHLILWDINEKMLAEAAANLRTLGKVSTQKVDLSDLNQITRAKAELGDAKVIVDVLVNNAGIVVGKLFHEHTHEDIQRTLAINSAALMHTALTFLPDMLTSRQAQIINIASAAGLLSNPRMSVYCASKWAVVGWSDSLRIEMDKLYPHVKVLTVCPYYVRTGMFDGVSSPVIPLLEPDFVVQSILNSVERGKIILRLPWIVNFLPILSGILPKRVFDLVVGSWFGIYKGMETFRGRTGMR